MRKELEKRPLLTSCLGLILGISAAGHLPVLLFLPVLLLCAGGAWPRAFVALSFVVGLLEAPGGAPPQPITAEWIDGKTRVESVPTLFKDGASCVVSNPSGRYLLLWPGLPELSLGDQINVAAPLQPPRDSQTEMFRSLNLQATIRGDKGAISVSVAAPPWSLAATRWRASFISFSERSMTPRCASAVEALSLNIDGRLPLTDANNLRRSGTYHIISASGLHVLIFASALLLALANLPIPRWTQLATLAIALAIYAVATGLHPPILRATVMAIVFAFAYVFRREPDLFAALALSAMLFLLFQPTALFEPGFQLSFGAVAGMALFFQPIGGERVLVTQKLISGLRSTLAASFIATLATAPIVAYHFGTLSLVSVFANALICFALPPILVLSMAAWAISGIALPIAVGIMRAAVQPLTAWVLFVADFLGSHSWSALSVPEFSAYWMIPYYGAALLLWRRRARQP